MQGLLSVSNAVCALGRLHQWLRGRSTEASDEEARCRSLLQQPTAEFQPGRWPAGLDETAIAPVHELGILERITLQWRGVSSLLACLRYVATAIPFSRYRASAYIVSLYNSIPLCNENAGRLIITDDVQCGPSWTWHFESPKRIARCCSTCAWVCNPGQSDKSIYTTYFPSRNSVATTDISQPLVSASSTTCLRARPYGR